MATVYFNSPQLACLFFGADGNGCTHQAGELSFCTCGKRSAMDALEVDFKNPAVDDLWLKTACCCYHCGFSFGEGLCAIRRGSNCCWGCYQDAGIFSCFDKNTSRAACLKSAGNTKCYQCEFDETCLCTQDLTQLNLCWCLALESKSVMRVPDCSGSCMYGKAQDFCMYSKFACPCNEEVPCELGLCGIMCCSKKASIQAWEAAHPELVGTGSVAASSPPPQVAQVAPAKDGGAPPRPDDAVVLQPTVADNRDLVHRLFPKVHVPGADVPRRVNWTM